MSVSTASPDLLTAQCAALSRLIPLMYFILVANAWVLTISFLDSAPAWLTLYASGLLTLICVARLFRWWRMRDEAVTAERAARELRRTNRVAAVLSVAFVAWAFALFPYGDPSEQILVGFFLTISMIGTMLCLIHIPSAALIVAGLAGVPFVLFFVSKGGPTFISMAINVMLVSAALVVVVLIQYRDFARMIGAQAEARRREQEQSRLLRMIDDMPVAVMTVDPATLNINYANATSKRLISRIEHLLPIKADKLVGTCIDVFHQHPEHQRRILADPARLPHQARIKLGPETLALQVSAVNDDKGGYIGPMLSWAIVTKEAEAESRIWQLAHYDALTGLPNRTMFRDLIEVSLAAPGSRMGLLFIDLDGFKLINDIHGHGAGDVLLQEVASRLRSACSSHTMKIGRLGGDEFAVLLPLEEPDQAEMLAGELVRALSSTYRLENNRHIQIEASIGIVHAPEHGSDAETLLARADIALYAAKAAGTGLFKTFLPEMERRVKERLRLEAELRVALEEQKGLFVFYQPIVDIHSGRVTAREALVRWHHVQRGWISPSEFVPVAEQSGLINELGLFVLRRACREATTWEDGARIAVNVSARQLGRGTLAPFVLDALVETGLPPDRLEIEVTESALLGNEIDSIGDLRRLREMGVRVALDDFGTGYSSLAHLRAFPFDKIKIDGSFVKDAVDRPDCAAVVKAIADLGRRLSVTTVAEGVETQAHLDRVREEGCSEVQGYLFGRPMPSERDAPVVAELDRAVRIFSAA